MPAMAMAGSCRKPATRSGLRQGAFEKVEAVLAPEQLAVQFEGRRAENLNLHRLLGIRLVDRLHRRAVGRGEQIGRAHVGTPVTTAHPVCRLLLEKKILKDDAHHTTL